MPTIDDDKFDLLMEVVECAIDLVDERRHGRFADVAKADIQFTMAVDRFVKETYDGPLE